MTWNPRLLLSSLVNRAARSVITRFNRVEATEGPRRSAALGRALANDTARAVQYAYNDALLKNSAYLKRAHGGYREFIVKEILGRDCTDDVQLGGFYSPFASIVAAYQNALLGRFGQEIRVDEKVDGRDVNPRLIGQDSPVRKLWRFSNLDTRKQLLQEWAANLGTVGLRIVAKGDADPQARRVWIGIDHPGDIYGFDESDRGNLSEVELRYPALSGPIGDRREVKVREILSRDRFYTEVDGEATRDERNALGVCPYVILRHADGGDEFGRWAYYGSEDAIHWLNWVITNQGESIIEYAFAQWFAAAGGNRPEAFQLGRKNVAYVKMDPDTPPPVLKPLVANVDHAGAVSYVVLLIDKLYERNPELILSYIKALSGQSGETIAKLQMPAVARIMQARDNYQDAIVRAAQIGLSEGIRLGMWDLGTGTGTAEAAERAFRQGLEDFAFAERPALPMSSYEQVQQAKADEAPKLEKFAVAKAAQGIVDQIEQVKLAGYTDRQAADMLARRQQIDAIPTEPL